MQGWTSTVSGQVGVYCSLKKSSTSVRSTCSNCQSQVLKYSVIAVIDFQTQQVHVIVMIVKLEYTRMRDCVIVKLEYSKYPVIVVIECQTQQVRCT